MTARCHQNREVPSLPLSIPHLPSLLLFIWHYFWLVQLTNPAENKLHKKNKQTSGELMSFTGL